MYLNRVHDLALHQFSFLRLLKSILDSPHVVLSKLLKVQMNDY